MEQSRAARDESAGAISIAHHMWGNNIVGKGCFARPSWGPAPTPDRRRHRMRQQQRYNIAVPAHRSESAESLRRSPAPTFSEARGRSKLEVRPETAGYEASTFNGTLFASMSFFLLNVDVDRGLEGSQQEQSTPWFPRAPVHHRTQDPFGTKSFPVQ